MVEARRGGRRADGRRPGELRAVRLVPGFLPPAEGSVLIEMGATRLVCTATVQESVPPFLRGQGRGWVTAEYGMLPRSSGERIERERRGPGGRTHEIQRLVGRSLRAVTDMTALGGRSIPIHCDVIQADGGTRTAARGAARLGARGRAGAHRDAAGDVARGGGLRARPRMIPPRLVLATSNRGKLAELRALLAEWGPVEVLSLEAFPGTELPEERASSYAENAIAKAQAVAGAPGLPALADDSGLEVDALGGGP